ncbi:hypothetical protein HMPREF0758_3676 [Serratia odorifera DSM 4582]|uniref:Uncharacterized protein n=1 Tax=Serratia odorifera DSM 4582 TaxID=667129 RepID=D4E676_SEROD|nr:hypothetical protein HMPREF0758_3676 [Serratia odorifera DSM 4582]
MAIFADLRPSDGESKKIKIISLFYFYAAEYIHLNFYQSNNLMQFVY